MFLIVFFRIYATILFNISPVIIFMSLLIVLLGMRMAKLEKWTNSRGIYCAFITATTVGYGVVHPTKPRTRFLAVVIACIGLVFTGIMVGLAFASLEIAARETGLIEHMIERLDGAGIDMVPGN